MSLRLFGVTATAGVAFVVASMLLVAMACVAVAQPLVVTYRAPECASDKRYDYDNAALKLALEKTRETWGDYKLVPSPIMNYSRAIMMLESGDLENPMFKLSANNEQCCSLVHAPFPVDLGVVGYRMFFASSAVSERLSAVDSLEKLQKFSVGQGFGWLDVPILQQAGFRVTTVPGYESLFHMVGSERFDILSRGVNEIKNEFSSYADRAHFVLNRKVGLYYPLPRFFYTDRDGADAARRVYEGLIRAFEDGSLLELWEDEYAQSLEFGGVKDVTFFKIDNPFIDQVDRSYERFVLKIR